MQAAGEKFLKFVDKKYLISMFPKRIGQSISNGKHNTRIFTVAVATNNFKEAWY
ncbi:hypothetical protein HUW51_13935 [Adhaeribacter swui]|uniref:Uncharacterized protein n=1 Tax=Adhaeribacter swui TaxID=2086471 RepID=A0A7G7G9D1_9BACT|nr:hypothetical protein HUW51_13935 [Adhaeribacter swui]